MKLFHLSDLHLGKRLREFSLLEDQEYVLQRILALVDEEKPDGVIVAGDVYDKSVPSGEAVALFDRFLTALAERRTEVLVISGNHDSPERLSFGSRLMDKSGIHLAGTYDGKTAPIVREDAYGRVNFYLLPFVKPVHVRRFTEETVESYTDAVRVAIKEMPLDERERNVLVTHQFVTGASRSESEEICVGGTDNVDASVFDAFDYVALGHVHSPQSCSREQVRYCGTPLKYSFSEARDQKSVTVVELKNKGEVEIRALPLIPRRDLRELKGTYEELTRKSFYENTSYREDYVHITLTDEEDVAEAVGRLRVIYRHLMKLDYDNKRTRASSQWEGVGEADDRSPLELFSDFYETQNGQPMTDEQNEFMKALIGEIWEEEQ